MNKVFVSWGIRYHSAYLSGPDSGVYICVWITVWQFNVSWKVVRDIHWVLYALNLLHRMNVDTLIMLLRVLPSYLSFIIFIPHLLHIFSYIADFRRFSQNWEKRQVTSSLPSVCPSVPHWTTRFPLDGFSRALVFKDFSKICRQIQVSLKSEKTSGYCTWTYVHLS